MRYTRPARNKVHTFYRDSFHLYIFYEPLRPDTFYEIPDLELINNSGAGDLRFFIRPIHLGQGDGVLGLSGPSYGQPPRDNRFQHIYPGLDAFYTYNNRVRQAVKSLSASRQ